MSKLLCLTTFVFALLPLRVSADVAITEIVCNTAEKIITQNHLATRDLTGKMFCELQQATKQYVVFAVRYKRNIKVEGSGSNLVGWYALRPQDNTLFEWDITREAIVGLGFHENAP
jgi:hypothetical protein